MPGGSLFIYSVENSIHEYTVGDHTFKSFPVNADKVKNAIVAGFGDLELMVNYKYFLLKGIRL